MLAKLRHGQLLARLLCSAQGREDIQAQSVLDAPSLPAELENVHEHQMCVGLMHQPAVEDVLDDVLEVVRCEGGKDSVAHMSALT